MADPASIINSKLPTSGLRRVEGIVVSTSPLTVRVGAATTATHAETLASYTPVVGHKVQILQDEMVRIIFGRVV